MMRKVTTSHHVSGTCKMGPASDPLAVVDQRGRVYGIDGLRVADAAIMPDCIRANTNVTSMVIGERIGLHPQGQLETGSFRSARPEPVEGPYARHRSQLAIENWPAVGAVRERPSPSATKSVPNHPTRPLSVISSAAEKSKTSRIPQPVYHLPIRSP